MGSRSFLDIPVGPDCREVFFSCVPGFDCVQRSERRGDAQDLGNGQIARQWQVLRKVSENAVDGHTAGARPQLAGDQSEQSAFPDAVLGHQPGSAAGHGE